MFSDMFRNHLLMNALLAWATAQILKFIIYLAVNRSLDWDRLLGDGGMPATPPPSPLWPSPPALSTAAAPRSSPCA